MSFLHVHHALESTLKTNLKITAAVLGEMADLESGECWPADGHQLSVGRPSIT